MDWGFVIDFMFEISYLLVVFMLFMIWATIRGRQAMINLIIGLYLALLLLVEFPYTSYLTDNLGSSLAQSVGKLMLFAVFTILMTWLCYPSCQTNSKKRNSKATLKNFC